MSQRSGRSLHVPGVTHGKTPIPMGARVGNVLWSSAIMGKDPATDTLPAEPDAQARFAFENMRALLAEGGATTDDIVRLSVYVKDGSLREHVNKYWLEMFPDADDRPSRHTQVLDLQAGMLVQLEVIAVIQNP
jgi:2-iminobutanoate/2-iminopropanoate deaminase